MKTKMTKRYTILQKKLEELENSLHHVFTFVPSTETPCLDDNHLLSETIEQRFVFLNSLLSAEIASSPKKPHHLNHIAQRLFRLESAFRNWENSPVSGEVFDNVEEMGSKCSCTESCLNDDGGGDCDEFESYDHDGELGPHNFEFHDHEGESSRDFEIGELGNFNDFEIGEKGLHDFENGEMGMHNFEFGEQNFEDPDGFSIEDAKMAEERESMVEEGEKERGRRSCYGCGSMASGVMVGMGLMWYLMVTFSACFHYVDHHFGLTPT